MKSQLNIITSLHTSTRRDYLGRMLDDKIDCMKIAKEYGSQFWDGERRYGYGGYTYDGRWKPIAQKLIDQYQLPDDAKILDVGCGKAFLLYELKKLLPESEVRGFDISSYAIGNARPEIKNNLFVQQAQDPYEWADDHFDLVLSLGTLHNLALFDLKKSLSEIERVGRDKYVMVEAYRNEAELFNLQCWALTCESFFRPEEWQWIFNEFGYSGDYEFIFFE